LTEKWLIGRTSDWKATDWWEHKIIFDYDHERQVNDPNFDGFLPGTTSLPDAALSAGRSSITQKICGRRRGLH